MNPWVPITISPARVRGWKHGSKSWASQSWLFLPRPHCPDVDSTVDVSAAWAGRTVVLPDRNGSACDTCATKHSTIRTIQMAVPAHGESLGDQRLPRTGTEHVITSPNPSRVTSQPTSPRDRLRRATRSTGARSRRSIWRRRRTRINHRMPSSAHFPGLGLCRYHGGPAFENLRTFLQRRPHSADRRYRPLVRTQDGSHPAVVSKLGGECRSRGWHVVRAAASPRVPRKAIAPPAL